MNKTPASESTETGNKKIVSPLKRIFRIVVKILIWGIVGLILLFIALWYYVKDELYPRTVGVIISPQCTSPKVDDDTRSGRILNRIELKNPDKD